MINLSFENWKNLLWDSGSFIRAIDDCRSKHQGTLITSQKLRSDHFCFVTPNTLGGSRRCEDNVTSRTTFVVEFDGLPLKDQAEYVKSIGMPYTTATFSGNKSIHYLIRLIEPISTKEEFKRIAKLIYEATDKEADSVPLTNSCSFTRVPFAVREDTGKVQTLLELKSRVANETLMLWLNERLPQERFAQKIKKKRKEKSWGFRGDVDSQWSVRDLPSLITTWLIERDFPEGKRNKRWFTIACKCCEVGIPLDETISILERYFEEDDFGFGNEKNFLREEWEKTIISAYRHVGG